MDQKGSSNTTQPGLLVNNLPHDNPVLSPAVLQEKNEQAGSTLTLRERNQYLLDLITYANAPIIVWDPQFRITLFNHAFEHLTGRTAAEVTGKPLDILLPQKCFAEVKDLIRKMVTGERWESVEIPLVEKNGKIRTVLWNSAPIYDFSGKTIISIIAQGQDITDRKRMERENRQRSVEQAKINAQLIEEISHRRNAETLVKKTVSELNAAIESTADGIYVVDLTGRIIRYNQNFASMWKIPDELLQSGRDSEVSGYLKNRVKNPEFFTGSPGKQVYPKDPETVEILELNDGRIFERYTKPQKMDLVITGRVMSYRDVTERRHAEEKLIASLQEKEILIREIHHRVKNNLQIISGLLDMTRVRTHDPATTGILTDMMLKIKTMAQIHTRLYESKQFDRINMGGQIRDQLADLANIYGRSGPEITCHMDADELNLPVDQAIPCALVVNEILSNSFKHAFKGRTSGNIMASARRENGVIHISIVDDGTGIPEDIDINRGTSLGLKLIRGLVQQLKGTLAIESTARGTSVNVDFPIDGGGG